jgi:plastocyanin
MKRLAVVIIAGLMSWGAWPSHATPPQFQIIIESGSPYYLPASAKVPTDSAIRWENPTASPHTITHDGCLTEEGPCVFDSGAIPPNGGYTLPGLPPGSYPYHCRLHPIMRGILTVTEPIKSASRI